MKRTIEVFTAGCGVCDETLQRIRDIACSSCDVVVRDTHEAGVMERVRELGITMVPAVVVDGRLLERGADGRYDEQLLREAGIGSPIGG